MDILKYLPLASLRSFLEKKTRRSGVYGKTFVLPIGLDSRRFSSEDWLFHLLRVLLEHEKGVFIDVGANLGQTLLKVAAIDPGRRYLGFEPNPACVQTLRRLIADNGLHAILVPAALSDRATVSALSFFHDDEFDTTATLVESFRPGRVLQEHAVVAISWDDVPSSLVSEKIGIVKIDVEGSELEVIKGLRPVLGDARPLCIVEVLPNYGDRDGKRYARQSEIENIMSDLNYRIFRIEKSDWEGLSGLEPLIKFGIYSDLSLSDYLLVPQERADSVMRWFDDMSLN